MRTSMKYPIRFWALVLTALLTYQFSISASADWCKYEKKIDLTMDLSSSDVLAISAAAGDLEVIGVPASGQAVIHAKTCASKQAWLEESDVVTREGSRAQISVTLPKFDGNWSLMGNKYAWMDLSIEVPQDLALEVRDSSGDIFMKNIAAVQVWDCSGDIEIESARDSISLRDSSGDIEIDVAEGDLIIESDSSGDIYASNINGAVLIKQDSSGDIRVTKVSDDVVVERDSSGDISASDVGGDFRVLKDGSGGISSRNIEGEIDIPRRD